MKQRTKNNEQGMAIISVTIILVLLAVVVQDFTVRSRLDYQSAITTRDSMRAHYLARSAMNLSELILVIQQKLDAPSVRKRFGDIQVSDFLPVFIGLFGGTTEEVKDLTALFGINDGTIENDEADIDIPPNKNDTRTIKGLGVTADEFDGGFDLTMISDDGKINLNCANGNTQTRKMLGQMLEALFDNRDYDEFFEQEDAEGYSRTRKEQISALIDYVDRDNAGYNAPGTLENYGYETLDSSYLPKNNYIDTVNALQLIRGVDDKFWNLFGESLTVYGECKFNLQAINDINVIATLIRLTAEDSEAFLLEDHQQIQLLAKTIKKFIGSVYFTGKISLNTLIRFARNPSFEEDDVQHFAFGGLQEEIHDIVTPPVGIKLNKKKLESLVYVGARRIYRIEAFAISGHVTKRIVAVWDNKVQRQNARENKQGQKGAWIYWMEE